MKSQMLKKLPNSPGVYFFKKGKNILYIGKATSIKDRVNSYWSKDIAKARGPLIVKLMSEVQNVSFVETDSVLEALILEAENIKKYQPIYNTKEKSNKSFNYVVITKEEFPKVLVVRGRELKSEPWESASKARPWKTFGPFPHGSELKEAMRIIRKIFPFRDRCNPPFHGETAKGCFNAQLGLCPGVCAGRISEKEYDKIVRHIILFFQGKKKELVKSLEKDMKNLAKKRNFEEANKIKKTIFALNHIRDVSLLKHDFSSAYRGEGGNNPDIFRIEAYDIAHLSGTNTVGVMVVVQDGEVDKSQYRKFKIKGKDSKVKVDDTANLEEVLLRRFAHEEWRYPNLIVVDGGSAQINVAKKVMSGLKLKIDVVSVVKDDKHKAREIIGLKNQNLKNSILLANSEAHRFAVTYHRKLRSGGFKL